MAAFPEQASLSVASWKRHRVHHHLPALADAVREDIAQDGPDLILNTGDLTNFGLPAEFANAKSWLATLTRPCLVVPGNHDAMVRESWAETGAHWAHWMEGRRDTSFPYCRTERGLAFIGVNSAIPTPPFMACGRVGKAQRDCLEEILDATRDHARVIMIHHPPRSGLVPWRKSLLDLKEVAAIIVRHGAAWCYTDTLMMPRSRLCRAVPSRLLACHQLPCSLPDPGARVAGTGSRSLVRTRDGRST
ncbi:metallophosphoesterase family protein [Asaia astilbis]|uniref:metallophosphoesterase family protein n=1 Tax=Asaia astilbis TaxID=610244 RepID=UPI0018DB09F2|nr:metallophosphoesterase [Asaia astilbis]